MRALMRRLRARQQTRSHRPHRTDSIVAGSRDVLAERPLVGDAADGLALGIVLGERRALAPERAASPGPGRRAGSTAPRRRRSRAARRAARRRRRPASGSRPRAACSRRPGRCPGTSAPAAAPAPRARRPPGPASRRAAWPGADATFAMTLLVAMPALAGRPSSPSIAPVSSSTARSIAASPPSSPGRPYRRSQPEKSRNISSMLATTHGRRVAPRDLADALGVRAVGVAAGRQVDRVGRQLARLDQRHARLHAQPAHLVAGGGHHAAAARAGRPRRPACPPAWDRARARRRRRTCRDPGSRSAAARSGPDRASSDAVDMSGQYHGCAYVQCYRFRCTQRLDTLRRDAPPPSDHEDRHLERELAGRAAGQGGVVARARAARRPADAGDEARATPTRPRDEFARLGYELAHHGEGALERRRDRQPRTA